MASDDRFYLMEMSNREVLWGDIGSLVRLEGVVIGGGGRHAILCLPGMLSKPDQVIEMDLQCWSDWLQRSDNPEILVGPTPDGSNATLPKIWHRKLRYEVSGATQQKIWAADFFMCMYCGRKMGEVLMTIDHFVPLELGGANDHRNYLTACKPCNKNKGSKNPKDFCAEKKLDYNDLVKYLEERKV